MRPGTSLTDATKTWPTPNAQLMNDGCTPEAWEAFKDREKAKGYNGNGHGETLAIAAQTWPTPDASAEKYRLSGDSQQSRSLEPVSRAFSHQVLETRDGQPPSRPTRGSSRRLNAAFVSWLMGLPWWWTNPAVSSSVRPGMELYLSRLHSHLRILLDER